MAYATTSAVVALSGLALAAMAGAAAAQPALDAMVGAKITVSDLRRSIDFYEKAVGLRPLTPGADTAALASTADFVELPLNHAGSRGAPQLFLIRKKGVAPTPPGAGQTMLVFQLSDVGAVMSRVKAAGYKVRFDKTVVNGMTFAIAYDPDGYQVEFLEAKGS
jgi:predicted enzyme related to lactoylglutathione lyase